MKNTFIQTYTTREPHTKYFQLETHMYIRKHTHKNKQRYTDIKV